MLHILLTIPGRAGLGHSTPRKRHSHAFTKSLKPSYLPACLPARSLRPAAHPLAQHPESAAALEELRTLFGFLDSMGALGPIVFDLRWGGAKQGELEGLLGECAAATLPGQAVRAACPWQFCCAAPCGRTYLVLTLHRHALPGLNVNHAAAWRAAWTTTPA